MRNENEKTTNCHDPETLTRFSLGDLHPNRYEVVASHVEQCVVCQNNLADMDQPRDEFVEGLQRSIPCDGYEEESECASSITDMVSRVESVFAENLELAEPAIEQLGRYRLLEKLGAGGMGSVYRALHTKLNRDVAIKILSNRRSHDPDAIARFNREMQLVGQLQHPHIVHATDADQDGEIHYLVMELVDGIDLSRLVRKSGPLGVADACELTRQAAVGLDFIHRQGMVHRDIKPSNLILTSSGQQSAVGNSEIRDQQSAIVKILDLGLALLHNDGDKDDLTSTGQVMGTVDYMAPEQVESTHGVDIRADIFSLGATLFKLLTGDAPLSSTKYGSSLQKLAALGRDEIPSISERRDDLPPELVAIVNRMLARDPSNRFQTPAEVVEALTPFSDQANLRGLWERSVWLDESDESHEPIVPTLDVHRKGRRRTSAFVVGSVATLLVIGLLVLVSRNWWFDPPASNGGDSAVSTDVKGDEEPPRAVAPFDREQAEQHQRRWASYLSLPIEHKNSLGMKFKLIPPGEFSMGEHQKDVPGCRVTLTQPFYLGSTEVTVGQFEQFAQKSGYQTLAEKEGHAHGQVVEGTGTREHIAGQSWRNLPFPQTADHPVLAISWHDAVAFCHWLSQKENVKYRLPTGAEWEYACRAGTTTLYWPGDEYEALEEVAACPPFARGRPQPVGQKMANPFGLFDVHGNAREWPLDYLAEFTESELTDPVGDDSPTGQIATRGGSFQSMQKNLRCAAHARIGGELRSFRQKTCGFRVLMEIGTNSANDDSKSAIPELLPPNLQRGLVAHWKLDGDVQDSSNNAFHGTLVGETEFVLGRVGSGALKLNGGYVKVAHDDRLKSRQPMSVAAWLNTPINEAQRQTVISKEPWRMAVLGSGPYDFVFGAGRMGNLDRIFSSETEYHREEWHHLAVVWVRPGKMTLYVDGIEDQRKSMWKTKVNDAGTDLAIGAELTQGPALFFGLIDDVRIYDRALTVDEVKRLFEWKPEASGEARARAASGWKLKKTYEGLSDVRSAHFNPRDGNLYFCSLKGVHRVEDDGRALQIAGGPARTLAIAPDGRTLLYSMRDKSVIRQIDLETHNVIATFDVDPDKMRKSLEFGGIDFSNAKPLQAAVVFSRDFTGSDRVGCVSRIRLTEAQPIGTAVEDRSLAMPSDVTYHDGAWYATAANGDVGPTDRSSLYRCDGNRLIPIRTKPTLESVEGICRDPLSSDLYAVCITRKADKQPYVVRLRPTVDKDVWAVKVIYSGLTLPGRAGIDISSDGQQMAVSDRRARQVLLFSRTD